MIGSGGGSGANVVTQRVMITSPRSAMWSLCRWVSSSAVKVVGADADRRGPLLHAAAAVDQERLPARAHQRRRSGPGGVGDRAAGAEQGDLDHGPRYTRRPPTIWCYSRPADTQVRSAYRCARHRRARRRPGARAALGQRHRQRTEVLLDAGRATGPGDRHGGDTESFGAVPQPRQRDLRRRRTRCGGDDADDVDHREVGVQGALGESGQGAAEVACDPGRRPTGPFPSRSRDPAASTARTRRRVRPPRE